MKTKISSIGKRSLSLVITFMMLVSMMLVGMVSASAAYDTESHFYLIGTFTGDNWNNNKTNYPINTAYGEAGKYYIEVDVPSGTSSSNPAYFALANSAGDRYAPANQHTNITNSTNADKILGTYDASDNSWIYTGSASKVRICIDQRDNSSDNQWHPYVWVEDVGSSTEPTTTEAPTTTPVSSKKYYITGRFGVKDPDGNWTYTSDSATGWNGEKTSNIKFTAVSDTLFSLNTNATVSDLSAYSSDLNTAWYIRIADGTNVYGTSSSEDIVLTADNASTKYTAKTSADKGWYFNDTDTSGNVILYFDDSTKEFYFTIDGSTPIEPSEDKKINLIQNTSALYIDANPSSEDSTSTLIKWNNKSGSSTRDNYIFYVPKNVDLTNAVVYNGFSSSVTIGSTTVPANGSAQVSLNTSSTYNTGKGNMQVMQGSTDAMFIEQSKSLPSSTGAAESKSSVNIKGGTVITMSNDGTEAEFSSALDVSNIKGRGNSSWEASYKCFGKYAFNMKLSKATNLLGMDAAESKKGAKSWCLLANNADESMLRNALAYDLANALGLPYAPEFRFVDIYDNNVYLGSYLVTEKVDVGKNKLVKGESFEDINSEEIDAYNDANGTKLEINEDAQKQGSNYQYTDIFSGLESYNFSDPTYDTRGTYILEFEIQERYGSEASWFKSNQGQNVVVKTPEFATKNQVKFVQQKFNEMETAIFNGADVQELSKYMDVESFVKMYLIQELSSNLDAASTSYYIMYDCSNGAENARFVASPVWDYDWAFGQYKNHAKYDVNGNTLDPANPQAWFVKYKSYLDSSNTGKYSIQSKLAATNTSFQSLIKKIWNEEFYPTIKTYYNDGGKIDQWYSQTSASVAMNEKRWHFIANDPISSWGSNNTGSTHQEAVNYLKTTWTKTRSEWLNGKIQDYADFDVTELATPTVKAYSSDGSTELTGSVNAGDKYYIKATTDDIFVTYYLYDNGEFVKSNDTGEFKITAVEGEHSYTVKTKYDDLESDASTPVTVTVIGSVVVDTYTISKTASSYGTISFTTSSSLPNNTANEGDTVTVTVNPLSNYICKGITVMAGSTSVDVTENEDGTYTFTMPASDVTITAEFEATVVKYTITGSASKGVLTFSSTSAQAGEKITVTATPNEGYICTSITATEDSSNAVELTKISSTKYEFVMPSSNVKVKAVFEVYTPVTEHTFTVYFKAPSAIAYQPKVSLDGADYENMTKDMELGKVYSGSITMYWFKAEFTVDTTTNHTLKFKTNRTDLNASITDFFIKDTYYLAVDNIMTGTEVVDLSDQDEYIRNYYRSATHMVYPYNGVDDNTDNTLGFTNIDGVRYKMGSYLFQSTNSSGEETTVASYSVKSATLMQRVSAGLAKASDLQLALLDVNLDGNINVTDATMMQKSLVSA